VQRRRKKLTAPPLISTTPLTTRARPPLTAASGRKSNPTSVLGAVQR
jgi:hypothetical protein